MGLIENVQSLCRENNISLPKLEKELGFGKGAMYNWDKSSPSIDKVQRVANYFKKSVDFLLYGFEQGQFVADVNLIKEDLTIEEFSKKTGIDVATLELICLGLISEPPSIDIVKKIAQADIFDVENYLLKLTGYDTGVKEPNLSPKQDALEELINTFIKVGYKVTIYTKEGFLRATICKLSDTVADITLKDFRQIAENLLKKGSPVEQSAEDWTEEECKEIEVFKKFLKLRRVMENTEEG